MITWNIMATALSYYVLGLLGAFAPCAYPLLPVLATYMVGSSQTRRKGLVAAGLFTFGLLASVLGLVAATIYARDIANKIVGSITAEEASSFSLLIMFIVGFLMLTPFKKFVAQLSVPLPRLKRTGLIVAIPLGALFFIASAPCDGAYVIALALNIASANPSLTSLQDLLGIVIPSAAFALGMSSPFFILALGAAGARKIYKKMSKSFAVKRSSEILGIALIIFSYVSLLFLKGDFAWVLPSLHFFSDVLWLILLTYLAYATLYSAKALESKSLATIGVGIVFIILGRIANLANLSTFLGSDALPSIESVAVLIVSIGVLALTVRGFAEIFVMPLFLPDWLNHIALSIPWLILSLAARSQQIGWVFAGFLSRGIVMLYPQVQYLQWLQLRNEVRLLLDLVIESLRMSSAFMLYPLASSSIKAAKEIISLKKASLPS